MSSLAASTARASTQDAVGAISHRPKFRASACEATMIKSRASNVAMRMNESLGYPLEAYQGSLTITTACRLAVHCGARAARYDAGAGPHGSSAMTTDLAHPRSLAFKTLHQLRVPLLAA